MFGHNFGGYGPSSFGGFANDWSAPWGNNADPGANSDLARELGADRISDQSYDAGSDQPADVDTVANSDDAYADDDSYDADSGDFDGDDGGGDNYNV